MYFISGIYSQRQKVADEKNIARIQKEMIKLSQQMSVTMEEYNKIQTINQSIREQLHAEEEKAFKMEESLKVRDKTRFEPSTSPSGSSYMQKKKRHSNGGNEMVVSYTVAV